MKIVGLQSGPKNEMLETSKTQIAPAMSEFKYACPVCGQHMKCDSSQSGTVMECPTCFQKIIAPQAPETDDPKFIIKGTKAGERPVPTVMADTGTPRRPPPPEESSLPTIAFIVLFFAAALVLFAFRGNIFKSTGGPEIMLPPPKSFRPPPPPPKPTLVAPPANDALWTLNLEGATIPNAPAAGRIHGQDFIVDDASFRNSTLLLRVGMEGRLLDSGIAINFNGAQVEALMAQTINVTTNTDAAAHVMLIWKNKTSSGRVDFNRGYVMRLDFGVVINNRLPGKIYLCTPDAEKSYLVGTFDAEVHRTRSVRTR
jgi:DNA-directed RNA polymerase subunit RPC12/RpoP